MGGVGLASGSAGGQEEPKATRISVVVHCDTRVAARGTIVPLKSTAHELVALECSISEHTSLYAGCHNLSLDRNAALDYGVCLSAMRHA